MKRNFRLPIAVGLSFLLLTGCAQQRSPSLIETRKVDGLVTATAEEVSQARENLRLARQELGMAQHEGALLWNKAGISNASTSRIVSVHEVGGAMLHIVISGREKGQVFRTTIRTTNKETFLVTERLGSAEFRRSRLSNNKLEVLEERRDPHMSSQVTCQALYNSIQQLNEQVLWDTLEWYFIAAACAAALSASGTPFGTLAAVGACGAAATLSAKIGYTQYQLLNMRQTYHANCAAP